MNAALHTTESRHQQRNRPDWQHPVHCTSKPRHKPTVVFNLATGQLEEVAQQDVLCEKQQQRQQQKRFNKAAQPAGASHLHDPPGSLPLQGATTLHKCLMVLEGSLAAAAAVLCDPGLVCQGLMAVQHKYGVDVATAMALRMQKSIQPDTLRAVEALVSSSTRPQHTPGSNVAGALHSCDMTGVHLLAAAAAAAAETTGGAAEPGADAAVQQPGTGQACRPGSTQLLQDTQASSASPATAAACQPVAHLCETVPTGAVPQAAADAGSLVIAAAGVFWQLHQQQLDTKHKQQQQQQQLLLQQEAKQGIKRKQRQSQPEKVIKRQKQRQRESGSQRCSLGVDPDGTEPAGSAAETNTVPDAARAGVVTAPGQPPEPLAVKSISTIIGEVQPMHRAAAPPAQEAPAAAPSRVVLPVVVMRKPPLPPGRWASKSARFLQLSSDAGQGLQVAAGRAAAGMLASSGAASVTTTAVAASEGKSSGGQRYAAKAAAKVVERMRAGTWPTQRRSKQEGTHPTGTAQQAGVQQEDQQHAAQQRQQPKQAGEPSAAKRQFQAGGGHAEAGLQPVGSEPVVVQQGRDWQAGIAAVPGSIKWHCSQAVLAS